jgi:hypothetical protein
LGDSRHRDFLLDIVQAGFPELFLLLEFVSVASIAESFRSTWVLSAGHLNAAPSGPCSNTANSATDEWQLFRGQFLFFIQK